jgi:hypothetical protein
MIDMTNERRYAAQASIIQRPLQEVDLSLVQPQAGQLYHLSGPGHAGRGMRPVAEHWVVEALARGEVVHWVDGACRIDPSRLLPALAQRNLDTDACLSRLYLSRGFTLHQLDRQIERLPQELAITRSPLVVIDGLLAMHQDDAIRRIESRILLRRHLQMLRSIVEQQHQAVVVITESTTHNPHQQRLVQHIHRHAQNHLIGHWQGSQRQRALYLHHPHSGLQGLWRCLPNDGQTKLVLTHQSAPHRMFPASVGWLALQHEDQ